MKSKRKRQAYVVVEKAVGRTKPGIHHGVVHVVGKDRAVFMGDRGTIGLLVPRSCVFKTREAAQTYMANAGPEKWVVHYDRFHGDSPEMYLAHVKESNLFDGYRSSEWARLIKRPGEKVTADVYGSNTRTFNTRPEAEAYMLGKLNEELANIEKEMRRYEERREYLDMVKKTAFVHVKD